MKKLAVILGAAVMMLTAAVPAMANSSDSPTTDAEKTKNAAGIVVCLKKRVR